VVVVEIEDGDAARPSAPGRQRGVVEEAVAAVEIGAGMVAGRAAQYEGTALAQPQRMRRVDGAIGAVLAAVQVPAVSGVPLSIEYRPSLARNYPARYRCAAAHRPHGRKRRPSALAGSSASQSAQALRRKCR
jgi:hypothetical protein